MEQETTSEQNLENNSIQVTLVGLKNMASTHQWRISMDVFEIDSQKVKGLVDMIDKSFHLFLVPIDNEEKNS